MHGGEGGIRTPGRLPFNGFQDRRFRPLSHLSVGGVILATGIRSVYGLDRTAPIGLNLQDAKFQQISLPMEIQNIDLKQILLIGPIFAFPSRPSQSS